MINTALFNGLLSLGQICIWITKYFINVIISIIIVIHSLSVYMLLLGHYQHNVWFGQEEALKYSLHKVTLAKWPCIFSPKDSQVCKLCKQLCPQRAVGSVWKSCFSILLDAADKKLLSTKEMCVIALWKAWVPD